MFETPVLFLIFNREDTTRKVFNAIRQQKPKYLFVAADGARKNKPGEAEKCQRVRDIIKQTDWDCELKTLFREENLGCKAAVSSAVTWFFENVEQGIILEDDCLPDPSFFPYCEELLNKYKDDTRIGHISGGNSAPEIIERGLSYDFCSCSLIWGWASWRRVWKNYDINLSFWEEQKNNRSFLFCNKWEEIYFSSFISDVLNNRNGINTWDTQYFFTLRLQNQLTICPSVNMVKNIGMGDPNAVHTSKKASAPSANAISFPLQHPQYVLPKKKIDNKFKPFSWKRLIRYLLKLY
ncbi:MAG: hypothetical protein FWF53_00455 [Candidatus Azobacteroides sp.]|nr:hypothetical protein [Candidatus Azobacteroides sp.]